MADPVRIIRQTLQAARLFGADVIPWGPPTSGPPTSGALTTGPPDMVATESDSSEPGPSVPTMSDPARSTAPDSGAEDADTPSVGAPTPGASGDKVARMEALRARYEADAPHQAFVTDHHSIVWGDGDVDARLMFVGEAPGAEEDRTGIPFVGKAGQLLNRMIEAMGLSRDGVYIANVLKTRPPNNATPTVEESRLCAPYLYEQIEIVDPEVIVTLGLPASRLLLDSTKSMGRLRGRFHEFTGPAGRTRPVMPTYHPAFLLRSYTPENRGKVWSDLQQVMTRLNSA